LEIKKQLIDFIDKASKTSGHYWSNYFTLEMKKDYVLELLSKIMIQSDKMPSEVVFVFLSSIRYIKNDIKALFEIEKNNTLEQFVNTNYDKILDLSVKRKVQANLPERGLPVMELIGKNITEENITLIELGASFGIIGQSLLNMKMLLENKKTYFLPFQQFPINPKGINKYIGIDIDPPDKEWLISCFSNIDRAIKTNDFINSIKNTDNFSLIKDSAIGFTKLDIIKKIKNHSSKIIVLTSFMLYQLDNDKQNQLKNEIKDFIKQNNGLWINMDVDLSENSEEHKYYIEINDKKVLYLTDDSCISWNY